LTPNVLKTIPGLGLIFKYGIYIYSFYDYKKDDMEGGGWNVLGFFLENSVAVFAVAFLITAGLAAYFFQVTGGMEFGL